MLKLNIDELKQLMKDFYILTGIRIVMFNENSKEILSYPDNEQTFCSFMRRKSEFDAKCSKSDCDAFAGCRQNNQTVIYKCHAGLTEAVAPIVEHGIIIGYLMFGQIRDIKNKSAFLDDICRKHLNYAENKDFLLSVEKIKYKSKDQILAAAKILDACTKYVIMKNYIKPYGDKETIIEYINSNLDKNLSVNSLCRKFGIGRTTLYSMLKQSMPDGISAYIRERRLELAKEIILSSSLNIYNISDKCGFSDYNYFIRIFKKKYGISPSRLRKKAEKEPVHSCESIQKQRSRINTVL